MGCGRGEIGASVRARLPGCTVVGVEANPELADEARERLDEVVCGVTSLPFPPASFDCVLLVDVLAHAPDGERLLAGARTLLTPDGMLVGTVPTARNVARIRAVLDGQPSDTLPTGYGRPELQALLHRVGFELVGLHRIRDACASTNPLPMDGQRSDLELGRVLVMGLDGGLMDDLLARELVFAARPRIADQPPIPCSVVITHGDDLSLIHI